MAPGRFAGCSLLRRPEGCYIGLLGQRYLTDQLSIPLSPVWDVFVERMDYFVVEASGSSRKVHRSTLLLGGSEEGDLQIAKSRWPQVLVSVL